MNIQDIVETLKLQSAAGDLVDTPNKLATDVLSRSRYPLQKFLLTLAGQDGFHHGHLLLSWHIKQTIVGKILHTKEKSIPLVINPSS